MIRILLLVLALSACASKPPAVVGEVPPTAEQSLATAQIGVAEQKQMLAKSYFDAVADCNKEKDFVFKFLELKCPETGCEISLNASSKSCDSKEARNTLVAALNSIREPVAPENFWGMVSNVSGDLKDLTLGIAKEAGDIATSSNMGLLIGYKTIKSVSENAGDRYTSSGDLVLGDQEIVSGVKVSGNQDIKTVGNDDISGTVTTDNHAMTAGTSINTGQIEDISGTKAGGDVDSSSTVENNPETSTVENNPVNSNNVDNSNSSTNTEVAEEVVAEDDDS